MTSAVWEWARALSAGGDDVTVLYDPSIPARIGTGNASGITIRPVQHIGTRQVRIPIQLSQLRDFDCLILHSGYIPANALVSRFATRAGTPYIVVPHGAYGEGVASRSALKKRLWLPIERRMLEDATAVHIFFSGEAPRIRAIAPGATFITAPTGIEIPSSRWTGTGDYLAWLGRYDIQVKGLDALIAAWAEIESPRLRLVLHGRDSRNSKRELQELVQSFGLEDSIEVLGPIEGSDKTEFLASSAGAIFPSRSESHSIAVMEALSLGVPCVLSRAMPIAEILDEAGAAISTAINPRDIAAACSRLEHRPEALAISARRFTEEQLNWSSVVQSFSSQLGSVIDVPMSS